MVAVPPAERVPILRHGETEIRLIGVTHWHPACALRAVRCLREEPPEVVAVELPEGLAPIVRQAFQGVYLREAGCAIPVLRGASSGGEAVILSAADAITQACWFAEHNGLPWTCIDLPNGGCRDAQRDAPQWPDPWAGLAQPSEYQDLMFAIAAASPVPEGTVQRDEHMAAVLLELTSRFRRIVAVVGAGHVPGIQRWLVPSASAARPRRQGTPLKPGVCSVARVSAVTLATRFLGPVPMLARRLAAGELRTGGAPFDARKAVEELVLAALHDYVRLNEQPLPVRQVALFWRAVWKTSLHKHNLVPSGLDLCRHAFAAGDEDFRLLISRHIFGEFVRGAVDDGIPTVDIPADGADGELALVTAQGRIPLWARGWETRFESDGEAGFDGEWRHIRQHQGWIEKSLDGRRQYLPSGLKTSDRTWQAWRVATGRVRALAASHRSLEAGPWDGGSLGRIDVPATIRARCRGSRSLWVERERTTPHRLRDEFRDFEPIVWVFEPGRHPHGTSFFTRDADGRYYQTSHVYLTGGWTSRECPGYVEHLGGRLVLAPTDALGAPEHSRALFLRWLHQSGRTVPLTSIWQDDSDVIAWLSPDERAWAARCPPHERLLLAALSYARRFVIYVRPPTVGIGPRLQTLARRKQVAFREVDLWRLGSRLVEQLRSFEFA